VENLEIAGNYTDVREMSGISLKVMEMSGNRQVKNLSLAKLRDLGERCKLPSGVWGEPPADIDFGVF